KEDKASKKLKIMEKPPIKMPQMVKFIEELVELATSTNHVLRYKCLKPQEMENGKAKVSPRLLQLSLREERLHGLLMTLTNSSVWAESIAGWLLSLGLANAGNQRLINAVAISFCGASPNLESQYGMSLAKAVIVY
ncbi:unnamed protein product, partial [Durusdinium trenchii]